MAAGFKALTVFEPRDLPVAIFVDDATIVGPFCAHCGFAEQFHTTGKVRGGTNKGLTITACPPPNGMNPMDPRCPACTLLAMKLPALQARHHVGCPARGPGSW